MAFETRIAQATEFETALFERIEAMGFTIAKNGTEHTHPDFVARLRQSADASSMAIRLQPDGVACIGRVPRSFFIDAKNAMTIEKTPYEHYMKLHSIGHLIVLVFGKLSWRWNFVEDIVLILGEETVKRFPHPFPVVDHWIVPRSDPFLGEIRSRNPQASFTPYREVNAESLMPWDAFKSAVIERLISETVTASVPTIARERRPVMR